MALKGWETVTLEGMSLKEQIQIFKEASHVLAPHGAGLVNTIWCQPKTKIFELQHKDFIGKKVYPVLSKHLDLEHTVVLTDSIKLNQKKPRNKKGKDMVDLKVDVPQLIRLLD